MPEPVSSSNPALQNEVAFLAGVDSTGHISAGSFATWGQASGVSTAFKWGGDTAGSSGGTVTYAFDAASSWNATEKSWFSAGLSLWSAVANIKFSLTADASAANFVFKRGSDGGAFEDEHLASSSNPNAFHVGGTALAHPTPTGAIISIDTSVAGFGPISGLKTYGGYPIMTLLHEEGHVLGLGHGGPYNGNVNAATDQQTALDTRLWTLMSYIEPATTTAKYASSYPVTGTSWGGNDPTTWMPLDILAIQRLYGVAVDTPLSGGQTFGFNCNVQGAIAPFFDFTKNTTPVVTVWDKGVGNTLDLSGFTQACFIDLNPGTFSSCAGLTNNVAIAFDTVVETAIGGSGNDRITGNSFANVLAGGLGADILTGGAGIDVFKGRAAELQGDTITDLVLSEKIWITDASLSSFAFSYANSQLKLSLNGAAFGLSVYTSDVGHFVAQADVLGGVDLVFVPDAAVGPGPAPVPHPVFGDVIHDRASQGAQIYALYDGLLGRAPDAIGMENWAAALKTGMSAHDLAKAFLDSQEGQDRAGALDNTTFVEQLYQATLHRHSDPSGLKNWTDALAHGTSRADVGIGFALSTEHMNNIQGALDVGVFVPDKTASEVARLYYGLLNRAPDAAGLENWVTAIEHGSTLSKVAEAFTGSAEYRANFAGLDDAHFVDMLYQTTLGRHVDPSGLDTWTNQLAQGHTRADVALSVGQSLEAQLHLLPVIEDGWHLA